MDFLLLVNSSGSADQTIKITDSCAHCSDPIYVEISAGKITKSDPESVWVQQGGG